MTVDELKARRKELSAKKKALELDGSDAIWSNQGTALHLLMIVARHRGGHSIGLLQGTLGLGDSSACRFPFLD